MREHVQEASF